MRTRNSRYARTRNLRPQLEILEDRRLLAARIDLLADIRPGAPGSFGTRSVADASHVLVMGDVAYFTANDGTSGVELWRTDGTAAGTSMVRDINPGADASNPDWMTAISDTVFVFAATTNLGRELWRSDGTQAGTRLLRDLSVGAASSDPGQLVRAGNFVYFAATHPTFGRELFRTNGTATTLVADLFPGSSAGVARSSMPAQLTADALGRLFFTAQDGVHGRELWVKPAVGVPTLVRDIFPGAISSDPQSLTFVGSTLFFSANTSGAGGRELLRTSGTPRGTLMVADLNGSSRGSNPSEFAAFGTVLYFAATGDLAHGRELYRSNGTAAGTVLVRDISPGAGNSDPQKLTRSGANLFFAASDGPNGLELWKTDGTHAGTTMVRNINTGSRASSLPSGLVDVQGTLFFRANDGVHGFELWESDGDFLGTRLVEDLPSVASGSLPLLPAAFGDKLFFYADSTGVGLEPHIARPNVLPTIEPIGNRTSVEGAAIDIPVVVDDADGDMVTITPEYLPPGITLVQRGDDYALVGTLTSTAAGTYRPHLRLDDGSDGFTWVFTWRVIDDTLPTLSTPGPQGNNEGNQISLSLRGNDPGGDFLTYSAVGLPPGLSISTTSGIPFGNTGLIFGTVDPHAGAHSPYSVTVSATDGSNIVSTTFTWTIGDFTTPTVTNPGPQRKNEGNLITLIMQGSDPEGDQLIYSATGLPAGLTLVPDGLIIGRLSDQSAGVHEVTVFASDGQNTGSTTFLWTVGDLDPPALAHPGTQTDSEGETVTLAFNVTNADDDPLSFRAVGLPPGLSIHGATGVISGTIAEDSAERYNVTVFASDGTTEARVSFVWEVLAAGPPPGAPDHSFDGDGKLTTDVSGGADRGRALAIQSDGKMLVAGGAENASGDIDFVVARYLADGSLDETFGGTGIVLTDFAGGPDQAYGIALQSDGKIVVVGTATRFGPDFGIARYHPDGTLDTTFGANGDGKVTIDFFAGDGTDEARAVVIQADGRIVVGGDSGLGGSRDFGLLRLNADGSLDPRFGENETGRVLTDFLGRHDFLRSSALAPDGTIIAAGAARNSDFEGIALARYDSDGILDRDFAGDGTVVTFVGTQASASAVALDAEGRIVVAGAMYDSETLGFDFAAARYRADGALDVGFGREGVAQLDLGSTAEAASALAFQDDGRLLLAGRSRAAGTQDFALIRLDADGGLDDDFGTGGLQTTDFSGLSDEALAIALDQAGRIVVAGLAEMALGEFDLALARYLV